MQTMLKFGVAYIHYTYIHTYTCVHAYIPTFKHYIHEYVYTHITPIYTCIVTKHEYIIFVQIYITTCKYVETIVLAIRPIRAILKRQYSYHTHT